MLRFRRVEGCRLRSGFRRFVFGVAPSEDVGRATIETDDPSVPAKLPGSASISATAAGWTLTLTNLLSGGSDCNPANRAAASNVSGLFQLNVLVPTNDLNAGTQLQRSASPM